MIKKKILIIGAESKIGKSLYFYLKKKNFKVVGTSRKKKSKLNYLNLSWNIKNWPDLFQCDVIICCAGITKIKDCDENKSLSKKINFYSLNKIIQKYKIKNKTQIIFFSSTNVFDGKKEFMKPKDRRLPQNNYGKLKKISEDLVLKNNGLVIRVGKIVDGLEDLLLKWIKLLKKNKKIYPYANLNTSLVSIGNLLDLVVFLINKNKKGIVHLSGLNEISYYQIASMLAKKINFSKNLVIPKKNFQKFSFKTR